MGAFITFRRAGLLVIFTLAVAASSVAGNVRSPQALPTSVTPGGTGSS